LDRRLGGLQIRPGGGEKKKFYHCPFWELTFIRSLKFIKGQNCTVWVGMTGNAHRMAILGQKIMGSLMNEMKN
jgi:hypothetical protein